MIVLTGGRQSGKTSAVIRWLMEAPGHRGVLVLNEDRKIHLIRTLQRAYPDLIGRVHWRDYVITVDDVQGGFFRGRDHRHGPFVELGIDDAEEVLSRLFGSRVEMAAMTATWIPLSQNNDTIKAYVEQPRHLRAVVDTETTGLDIADIEITDGMR